MRVRFPAALAAAILLLPAACATAPAPGETASDPSGARWAIVIHGGAGTISRDLPAERKQAYVAGLRAALRTGTEALAAGEPALAVVEKVVRQLEDDPLFNAGRGAVYTSEGRHELDAAIMDGRDLSAGAVAAVTTVRHPITLARLVMTETPHVLLVGEGAEAFADQTGVERVRNEFFDTPFRREAWERARQQEGEDRDTVGCVVLDTAGNLAAATSTGGLTNKRFGRVGDVPIVGAGTYADNRTAALSGTGRGEEFIRHNVTAAISHRMRLLGESLEQAAQHVIHRTLQPEDGGVIGVDARGNVAMVFNSTGMYRGTADSAGRFEVAIWEDVEE
ncbi:MAG TPA: isoaspartyl peptidase/L-asparaginase [Thermoanaerobaculia bacterium]|nr:isoaspartyl peptidase/L-asparaginase [Thermoanaerobaculia bacterium]